LRPTPPRRRAAPAAPVALVEPAARIEPAPEPLLDCALSALAPVCLEIVRDAERVAQWDELVARWHPLGFQGAFGYRLRYFITSGDQRLGCLLLSGAARAVALRDHWIGWSPQARRDNVSRVVNNSRFLIFPHVRVPHLASHVLGQLARRARADWLEHWGFEPLLAGNLRRPALPFRHLLPRRRLAVARADQRARAGPPRPVVSQHAASGVDETADRGFSRRAVRRAGKPPGNEPTRRRQDVRMQHAGDPPGYRGRRHAAQGSPRPGLFSDRRPPRGQSGAHRNIRGLFQAPPIMKVMTTPPPRGGGEILAHARLSH
jgi:hypothetical protein